MYSNNNIMKFLKKFRKRKKKFMMNKKFFQRVEELILILIEPKMNNR